jgi:phosphatidylglycerophosphate synthase
MLYKNRERFDSFSNKLGKTASKIPLSANQWTILSLITAIVSAYFIANNVFTIAALFLAVTAFLDVIDGAVARYRKTATKKGAYADTVADRYTEFILLVSMTFAALPAILIDANIWIVFCLFGCIMTTYAKSAAKEKEVVDQELKGGLLERSERLILLFVGLCLAIINTNYFVYILILYAVLTNITALQRIIAALRSKNIV